MKKKMNTKSKSKITALFLAAILVMTVGIPLAISAISQNEDASSSVTVIGVACDVESVSVDPDPVILAPGVDTDITITVEVYCPSGIDFLKQVELTEVEPYHADDEHFVKAFPLPMKMKKVKSSEGIQGTYTLIVPLGYCLDPGDYTLTVTATCKEDTTSTGTGTLTVAETLAISVTDVEFGSIAPGQSSDATSTVTKMGNVRLKFEENDGIVPFDMSSGKKTIAAENIAVSWDWSTILVCRDSVDAGFTLTVPFGTPPGRYAGSILFTPTPVSMAT